MVDVGYFIDGRHGVIRNVTPLSNTKTEHLCFIQADGEEQYALKKENIEYIIPHETTCADIAKALEDEAEKIKAYMDSVKKNYEEDDKPLTNAEKFKEVFGFEPNTALTMCDLASCSDYSCNDCPYEKICYDWWNEKYTGEFNVDAN